jgi:Aminoglycoside adenylyltransferase, C-terminal domain
VTVTPYPELDELLEELLGHWRRILGDDLVGAYVQGSFALGAGDLHSDCDFLVATRGPLTSDQEFGLRALHAEVPHRQGHWCHHLEGSVALADELATVGALGRAWLFVDHGWDTMEWDDHCNRAYTRWILREHGITLAGPPPPTWMAVVPAASLRRECRTALPTLLDGLATWIDLDAIAWGQRYAVVTACRMVYTIVTAEVASKPDALAWAGQHLDPRWRPLLRQVRDDRSLGFDPDQAPRPGAAAAARAFVEDAVTWAERHH